MSDDKYYLKNEYTEEEKEVTIEEYCYAERSAGFRPKMSSSHPKYMSTPATAGFSSGGVTGRISYGSQDEDIPEVGKTYNCFDDGKVKESKRYEVTVTEIILFSESSEEIKKEWEEVVSSCSHLYSKNTDYFVVADSTQHENVEVFARTIDGGWFGIGDWFGMGRLDTDGSRYKGYLKATEKN